MNNRTRGLVTIVLSALLAFALVPSSSLADEVQETPALEADGNLVPDEEVAVETDAEDDVTDIVSEEPEVETDEILALESDESAPLAATTDETPESATIVASIDDVTYTSIDEAFSHAYNGSTIKLLADCVASDTLNVTVGVTLDTNGFTLSNGFNDDNTRHPLINVTGTLDIYGSGTVTSTTYPAIGVNDTGCLIAGESVNIRSTHLCIGMYSTGYVNVLGANIYSERDSAIYVRSAYDGGCTVGIYSGTLGNGSSSAAVVFLNDNDISFEMRGGTITGGTGIEVESAGMTANVYGGTIDALYTGIYCLGSGSPVNISGGSISGGRSCISTPDDYPWSYQYNVTGGTFSGPVDVTNDVHFIYGGTFDTQLSSDYLASGYVQNASGGVEEVIGDNVCRLVHGSTRTKYLSLAEAIAAAQDGDTIVILKDITMDAMTTIDGIELTLDLAGHTIGYEGSGMHQFEIVNGGKLIVMDSSSAKTGTIDFSHSTGNITASIFGSAIRVAEGCVEVQSGTVIGTANGIYANRGDGSGDVSVNITGGSVQGSKRGVFSVNKSTVSITGGEVTGGIDGVRFSLGSSVTIGDDAVITGGADGNGVFLEVEGSTISITGGTITGGHALNQTHVSSEPVASDIAVSGGDFYGTVEMVDGEGCVTGGTFDELYDTYVAPGYYKKDIEDDRVTVIPDTIEVVLGTASATYDRANHMPAGVQVRQESTGALHTPDSVIWTKEGETVTELVDAGTYTATATVGGVTGTAEFVIHPRNIDEALPDQSDSYWTKQLERTGGYDTAGPIYNGSALRSGTDYSTSSPTIPDPYYEESWSPEVTYEGKGNFCGSASRTVTYLAYRPTADELTINDIPAQIMHGSPATPNMSVQWKPDGVHLVPWDCKVEYENNTEPGTGTAIAILEWPWYGSFGKDFTILDTDAWSEAASKTYSEFMNTPSSTDGETYVQFGSGETKHLVDGQQYVTGDAMQQFTQQFLQAVQEMNRAQTQAELDAATEAMNGIYDAFMSAKKTYEAVKLIPIYRMYNTKTSEHLWTKSKKEYESCGSGNYKDWRQENIAWYSPNLKAPASYAQSTQGNYVYVYRLYDKGRTGDHIYLTYGAEMKSYLANGWVVDKGAGFWTLKKGATISGRTTIPIYRAYNPKLKRGKHHYTPSKTEYDTICKKHGWKPEGVKFYVIKK